MSIAIITACPSGIANSQLAAGMLEKAANKLQLDVNIEAQSSLVPYTPLTQQQIQEAEYILVASDIDVDLSRFVDKPVAQISIQACLSQPMSAFETAKQNLKTLSAQDIKAVDAASNSAQVKKIVAITACPTGVAHTFMAAEALEDKAKAMGYQIKVETRGSVGAGNELTADDIENADLVIIAADIDVPLARFQGKKLYKTSTGLALKKTEQEINKAFELAQPFSSDEAQNPATNQEKKGVYKHLMTGVSHMLPLVVAGGLCIALSFVFGIKAFEEEGTLAAALMTIGGGSAFALMIPVLAGYIAFSIADRPGLTPGLIGGMLASSTGAGFIGGIIAGFLAGYSAQFIAQKLKLPQSVEALKPILIIPLVASLFTGLIMIYVVGSPVAAIMAALTEFLNNMGSANAILLGIILGAMMCFDLGGPINKAAYTFGVGLLSAQTYGPMAAVMAAGMIPPLGMGLATILSKKYFDKTEQEAGKASMVLGLCFITEGAIPFAAKDPIRVIPSCILGGAVTGAMTMFFGAQLLAPHGGLFVLLIPNAINVPLLYLFSIIVGTLITGFTYAALRRQAAASTKQLA